MRLQGQNILLGVSSSVAIYKALQLISLLRKEGATVRVIETPHATEFISPKLFEAVTLQPVAVDTFERGTPHEVEHISWAQWADLCILAPATAHLLARCAHGLADDMLTTTLLATRAPVLFAPAMNTAMYDHPATQENLRLLKTRGWEEIAPMAGLLACGDVGKGKLAEPEMILERVLVRLKQGKDLQGKRILVTAGPTREAIDAVRFISNYSTGKMGYALAEAAQERGAKVCLVSGPVSLPVPSGVEWISVQSAAEMYEAVVSRFPDMDWVIKAAAVADFTLETVADQKLKKQEMTTALRLKRTRDILASLGKTKQAGQLLCGFAMETEDLIARGKKKLEEKNLDMICCNNLKVEGAGFGTETNVLTLLTQNGREDLPTASKRILADQILDRLLNLQPVPSEKQK